MSERKEYGRFFCARTRREQQMMYNPQNGMTNAYLGLPLGEGCGSVSAEAVHSVTIGREFVVNVTEAACLVITGGISAWLAGNIAE